MKKREFSLREIMENKEPFLKESIAYSLQNVLEFGKARTSSVLPKLFQHGLDKENIKEISELVDAAVNKANSMNDKERKLVFEKIKDIIKERVHEERGLNELPGSAMKGKMIFRLAPFPSGALHIGNAKTYLLNALYAEKYGGDIILVMDDTIGSSEKPLVKEGYELIEEAFNWLNIRYKKPIYYKSSRLNIYYKYALSLIEKGKAYVCYCTQDELRENRANGIECSCRRFPKSMQLLRWKEMFDMDEGHAVLRIKTNMQHPNPAFRDRVLFKISDREHPKVGKKFRVWPSLEMSWAIDDHLLGITHIIRGNELMIETMMEKYIWDIFKWKHPEVIHTGLVKLEGLKGKISKSKAQKEVLSGEYIGWDDPRTWSVQSLARRGLEPLALRDFVQEIGLNKQNITIPVESLYAANRKIIDEVTNRYSFVINPKRISVENALNVKDIDVRVHPDRPHETRKIRVGKSILVSSSDFEELEGKIVRLLHLFNIRLKENTTIDSIENRRMPRINWVSGIDNVKIRIFMPDAEWISGVAEEAVKELNVGDVIQFERFGFCRYDGKHKGIHEFWFGHK